MRYGTVGIDTARRTLSVDTVAAVCAALMIWATGSFLALDLIGVRRVAQGVLVVPVLIGALGVLVKRPRRLLDPLVAFMIVRLLTELLWRVDPRYVADCLCELAAFAVITGVSRQAARKGIDAVIAVAAFFAAAALAQQVLVYGWPSLFPLTLQFSPTGEVVSGGSNPVAWLGLCTAPNWIILGQPIGRCSSFVRETSLLMVFFGLPACLALLLDTARLRFAGAILVITTILSLCGSFYLSIAFGVGWWLISKPISVKRIFPYGILLVFGGLIYVVSTAGVQFLVQASISLGRVSSLLVRTRSITDRLLPALHSLSLLLKAPLGTATLPDASGPWLINVGLQCGWLGVILLVLFLIKAGRRLHRYYRTHSSPAIEVGTFLYCGIMSTVLVFNDYQMITYAGLTLLTFIYVATASPVTDVGLTTHRREGQPNPRDARMAGPAAQAEVA